jgi:hypothetical protein
MRYVAAGVVVAMALLGGCGTESDPPTNAGQEPTVSPSTPPPTPEPSTPGTPTGPTPSTSGTPSGPTQGPVEKAKADLAARLGLQPGEISLVSSEEVTWPDGSLGCPQPGMRYTQALVNGSRIVLEASGKRYNYHSGGRRGPFLCTNPRPPVPSGG